VWFCRIIRPHQIVVKQELVAVVHQQVGIAVLDATPITNLAFFRNMLTSGEKTELPLITTKVWM